MSVLAKPYFHNEEAAIAHLEGIIWANGIVCPKCGEIDRSGKIANKRPGLRKCYGCRKQFTVKVGTVFEASHIPLHKWLQAAYLMSASKKGFSAHQLHRTLEVTYKTAWFMAHRIREAMKVLNMEPIGGEGKHVQMDETYFGTKDALRGKTWKEKKGHSKKMSVVSLVSEGKARTFHVDKANAETVEKIVAEHMKPETALHTDESRIYKKVGKKLGTHKTVLHHSGQYVTKEGVTTNHVEGYFSIFKRGMKGTYQHCSEKHLHRYLAEFDFRYNERTLEDSERANIALAGITGKRLMYRDSSKV